jgi:methylenetetrahydrofolate dehydrogenase (NADP+)/methenyltetrahydrofolate cyclohydrolase
MGHDAGGYHRQQQRQQRQQHAERLGQAQVLGRRGRFVSAQRIDGKAIAARVRAEVAASAAALRGRGIAPTLAVVLVGDDPASAVYVRSKTKAAREAGVDVRDHTRPETTSQAELLALVRSLCDDPIVDGILVQMPLPRHLDSDAVIRAIDPAKDVDGLTATSLGYLAQGRPLFVPCTPKGCMRLLREAGAEVAGARAAVLGRSLLVGKPIALLLSNANATVTLCHSKTRDLAGEVRRADIVVAAIGRPELVRGEWIAEGAIVLDVGINRTAEGKLIGDVEFLAASQRARAITPVPGGVGPMTIASLLENTVEAAQRRRG